MNKKVKFIAGFVLALLIIIFFSAINYFANLVIHPSWHKPGLNHECSTSQLEFSKDLCTDNPEAGVNKKYEAIRIEYLPGKFLEGWLFKTAPLTDKLTIFVHGAGADRRNGYRLIPYLNKAGYSVLIYDSPNHGRSFNDGRGVSFGVREGTGFVKALEWSKTKFKHIFIIATSAGTSTVLLSKDSWKGRIEAAVLENPFYSLRRLVSENETAKRLPNFFLNAVFAYVSWKGGFDVDSVNPGELAKNIPDIPILVLHGTDDRTVPYQHGVDVYNNLNVSMKEFFKAANTDHCRVWDKFPKEFESKSLKFFAAGLKK